MLGTLLHPHPSPPLPNPPPHPTTTSPQLKLSPLSTFLFHNSPCSAAVFPTVLLFLPPFPLISPSPALRTAGRVLLLNRGFRLTLKRTPPSLSTSPQPCTLSRTERACTCAARLPEAAHAPRDRAYARVQAMALRSYVCLYYLNWGGGLCLCAQVYVHICQSAACINNVSR